jgi:penicillin-binding protein 1A
VTVLSLTSAFTTFANAGARVPPTLIRRVETTDGEVLYEHHPKPERIVSEATAFIMTSMLSDVVAGGTAAQARSLGLTVPAAGKTGTTNDYHDAWFVGYTPSLAAGVWIGYDRPRTIMEKGYAATLAVPLWARFMAAATRGQATEPFAVPAGVRPVAICRISGKLATDRCRNATTIGADGFLRSSSSVETEYFVAGTEPHAYCQGHSEPVYEELVFEEPPYDAPFDAASTHVPDAIGTTGDHPASVPQPPAPVELASPPEPAPEPPPVPPGG